MLVMTMLDCGTRTRILSVPVRSRLAPTKTLHMVEMMRFDLYAKSPAILRSPFSTAKAATAWTWEQYSILFSGKKRTEPFSALLLQYTRTNFLVYTLVVLYSSARALRYRSFGRV